VKPNKELLKQAASYMGRMGGKKGGKARAAFLSKDRRHEIAVNAAKARWRKARKGKEKNHIPVVPASAIRKMINEAILEMNPFEKKTRKAYPQGRKKGSTNIYLKKGKEKIFTPVLKLKRKDIRKINYQLRRDGVVCLRRLTNKERFEFVSPKLVQINQNRAFSRPGFASRAIKKRYHLEVKEVTPVTPSVEMNGKTESVSSAVPILE
jgi:hypothetical protein